MKNQAILTLLADKQEVLKVGPCLLSPRGCEFICTEEQIDLFRMKSDGKTPDRYAGFQVSLGLFPHSGPMPQYLAAQGHVTSVRRSAQDCYCIILQFDEVSPDGYRLMAEHLSNLVVTQIDTVQSKSA
ncbi:MAG: hypothetical protein ACI910_000467 [Oleispira sp.]|jgi:hypothetical protein